MKLCILYIFVTYILLKVKHTPIYRWIWMCTNSAVCLKWPIGIIYDLIVSHLYARMCIYRHNFFFGLSRTTRFSIITRILINLLYVQCDTQNTEWEAERILPVRFLIVYIKWNYSYRYRTGVWRYLTLTSLLGCIFLIPSFNISKS